MSGNRHITRCISLWLVLFTCSHLQAQKASLSGIVKDTAASGPLHYAIVALLDKKDSTLVTSSRSAVKGEFTITNIKAGNYVVMITYPGMADFLLDVTLKDTGTVDIGKIVMTSRYHLLQEVVVRSGRAIRMNGDTLEFRADSFAVPAGANVEELLRRLPGIEVGPDGKLKAQGENVARVLVDGDEFFNDDPTLATRYLQAKSIDKVQVFDKKSDQAMFSGIDDGVRSKTINLKLKANSKNGFFGKLSAGTDLKDFYNDAGMINLFKDKKKVSVFATGSNTGATGLSGQDDNKYLTSFRSGADNFDDESTRLIGINFSTSDRFYGSGLPASFYTGAQYANKWDENKKNINLNYRLNDLHTNGWQTNTNTQLLPDSSIRASNSHSSSTSFSRQQKMGGYYDLVIDSFSTMKITVQGQVQNSNSANESYSEAKDGAGNYLNKSSQQNNTGETGTLFNTTILWQHNFRKRGRGVSVTLMQNYGDKQSTKRTEALSYYYTTANPSPAGDSLNQEQLNKTHTNSYGFRLTYTEPLAKNLFLSTEFNWRKSSSEKDRNVMMRSAAGKYDQPVDSLSNNYTYDILSSAPGVSIQYNPKKLTLSAGGKLGFTSLKQVDKDLYTSITRQYVNLFPQINSTYSFSQSRRVTFNYSGRTLQPSIEQLQPLRENSNPLYVQVGNPDLQPGFAHNVNASYNYYKMSTGANVNFSINWSQTFNAIIGSQSVDQFNKTTSQYVNRNTPPGFGTNIYYSRPLSKQGSKHQITIGGSLNANHYSSIRILNNTEIRSDQFSAALGPTFSFYKFKGISLFYNGYASYSKSNANIGTIGSNVFWNFIHNVRTTIYFPWSIELSSDVSINFQPANGSFSTSRQVVKWNALLTKKFLKNGDGQVSLGVFDILNQNTGYNRYTTGTSYSESSSNYIPRYALLSLTWNFTRTL